MTSLFLTLNNDNASCNAAEPLFTAIQCFDFVYLQNSFSNFFTLFTPLPEAQNLDFKTSVTDLTSSFYTN